MMDSERFEFAKIAEKFEKVVHPIDEWLDLLVPYVADLKWINGPKKSIKSASLILYRKDDEPFQCQLEV